MKDHPSARPNSDITAIESFVLPNGLTVWLNEDHSQNKIIGTVIVHAGAKDSPNTGIPHYFEHIMFKGTSRIGTVHYEAEKPYLDQIEALYHRLAQTEVPEEIEAIQKEINQCSLLAAQWAIPNEFNNLVSLYGGSRLNAATGYDYTLYYNTFSPQYLEHWCRLYSERFLDPVFRLFQSELETVYEEKNMIEDQLDRVVTQKIIERFAYPHPYAYPVIGSTAQLKKPDLLAMKQFYKQYYVAANMGLLLCGDFDTERVKAILSDTFSRLPKGSVKRPIPPQPQPFQGVETFKVKFPVPEIQAAMLLWRTVPSGHYDELVLDFIIDLFSNESKTGLLDKRMLEGELMIAGAMGVNFLDLGAAALYALPSDGAPLSEAKEKLLSTLEDIKKGRLSDQMFEAVRKEKLSRHLSALEDLEKRSSVYTQLLARGLDANILEQNLERLRNLSKDELVVVANKYFGPNYLEVEKETGSYPKDKISKPSFKSLQPSQQDQSSSFAKFLTTLPVPPATKRFIDYGQEVQPVSLGRGASLAKLYTEPNPVNKLFTLDVVYQVGKQQEPILGFLDAYLVLLGTSRYSAQAFNEALQTMGSFISITCRRRQFEISIKGFDDKLEETLALLQHFFEDLQPDPKKLKQIYEEKRLEDQTQLESSQKMTLALSEYLRYGEQSYFLKALSLSELKALHSDDFMAAFRRLLSTEQDYHYVGNLPTSQVKAAIERVFDIDQVTRPAQTPVSLAPRVPECRQVYFLPHKDATQTSVSAFLFPEPFRTKRERAALSFYNNYLGGGMSSLLFQEVREYRSLAYSSFSSSFLPPYSDATTSPILQAYLSTQADKVGEATMLLDELLQRAPDSAKRWEAVRHHYQSVIAASSPSFRDKTREVVESRRNGYPEDPTLMLYRAVQEFTQEEIIQFFYDHIASAPKIFAILGNPDRIDFSQLRKLGNMETLSSGDVYRMDEGTPK